MMPSALGLDRKQTRTITLAALGAMLEYYDFVIFLFVVGALGDAFFPPDVSPWVRQMQTLAIFATGYFVRPVAGLVFAHFADLIGRKKMFIFLLILMAVPTFLIGVLPTYAQAGVLAPLLLLLMRALQGCAVGGEFPGAAVFVAEHAPARRLGTASGLLHGIVLTGLLLGAGAAALSATLAARLDVPSLAWRLPFIVGGLFGLTAAYLRRQLEESPLYVDIRRSRQLARNIPLKIVVSRHRDGCLFGLAVGFVMAVGTVVFFQYMPNLLATEYGVPRQTALQGTMWGSFVFCLSMPLWGRLSDTLGWVRSLTLAAAVMALAPVLFFYWLPGVLEGTVQFSLRFTLLFSMLGLALGSVVALVPGLLSALFPTPVRQSGYALPYNLSAALFAGTTPLVLAWLVRGHGPTVVIWPVVFGAAIMALSARHLRRMRLYLGSSQLNQPLR